MRYSRNSRPGTAFGTAFGTVLVMLLAAACGEPPPERTDVPASMPADGEARALHCYLVLTLTLDQMAEFEGGRARGGMEELLRARERAALQLDEELLEQLRRDPRPSLEALLEDFDADGDGELSTAAELAEFNRHVRACL
jgi:hypothetical protein